MDGRSVVDSVMPIEFLPTSISHDHYM